MVLRLPEPIFAGPAGPETPAVSYDAVWVSQTRPNSHHKIVRCHLLAR